MKNELKHLAFLAILSLLLYLPIAFYFTTFNFMQWHEGGRFCYAFFWAIIAVCVVASYGMSESK